MTTGVEVSNHRSKTEITVLHLKRNHGTAATGGDHTEEKIKLSSQNKRLVKKTIISPRLMRKALE